MPFCRECGKEVQEDWVNCPYCSSKIQNNDVKIVSSTPNAVIVVPNEKKGSNGFIVLTVLGILALIGGIAFRKR